MRILVKYCVVPCPRDGEGRGGGAGRNVREWMKKKETATTEANVKPREREGEGRVEGKRGGRREMKERNKARQ